MPMGKNLKINILDTWGDVNYVGMSGVEIFNNEGSLIQINDPS